MKAELALGGWLHTEIKCRLRESIEPGNVTHPSTNRLENVLLENVQLWETKLITGLINKSYEEERLSILQLTTLETRWKVFWESITPRESEI